MLPAHNGEMHVCSGGLPAGGWGGTQHLGSWTGFAKEAWLGTPREVVVGRMRPVLV